MSLLDDALPHLPRLRRHARLLCGDATRADDLVQDTLERAARQASHWTPTADRAGSLRAWLLTLMHHLYLNQLRALRPHLHEVYDADLHDAGHEPAALWQTRLDLERALAQLTPAAREVLLLVGVEELSYEESAAVLGVPVGTVMSRLARARERLRSLMAEPDRRGRPATGGAPALRVIK
ncbi:RNA polymerase sigma factor [Leptothrix sp. BB-4]